MAKQQQQQQQQQGMATATALVVVALLLAETASAATCNAGSLTVCASALLSGTTPTPTCCSNLKAQQSCFCQYAKNPTYARYINSPNARKVLTTCSISLPRC